MPSTRALAALLLAAGCHSDQVLFSVEPDLEIELTSPEYGAFLGQDAAVVTGRVNVSAAQVTVEGEPVSLDEKNGFSVEVPVDGPYLNVDVVATLGNQKLRERVPVFSGRDPLETWPGGVTGRVLQPGLDMLGANLGLVIDGLGWADQIAAALPEVDQGWVVMTPTGVSHDDTSIDLVGAEGGIDTGITLHDLRLLYELAIDVYGFTWTGELAVGYDAVSIGALAVPAVDEAGMVTLSLTDPYVEMDDAQLEVDGLDLLILEWLLDGVNSWVSEPLSELVVDLLLGQVGTLELGGPFAFQTSLMGTDLGIALDDVYGEPDGLGLGIGVEVTGLPEVDGLAIEAPFADGVDPEDAQVAIGLHEGLFQALLTGDLLDMLSQDLDLSGSYGELIGSGLRNLPGGDQAPDGDGWCLRIDPGQAKVARMHEGVEPLASLYLPDFRMNAGTIDGTHCLPWIEASLAVEADFAVTDGTALSFDFAVPDGILLYYGADDGSYTEEDVIAGLGSYLETMIGLLGGAFQLDLADILGGLGGAGSSDPLGALLGDLDLQIVGSTALLDDGGNQVEGAYAVTMDLWSE